MMTLEITRQENYSRGQLLLRTFFGVFYIMIPHIFVLLFFSIGDTFVRIIGWWSILFTGAYPKELYNFRVKLMRYQLRLSAVLMNLVDGYPAFGLNAEHPNIKFDVEYPETLSRGKLLLRTFFGLFYIGIPHIFCLYFLQIAVSFMSIWAWFSVLFSGQYPESAHTFIVKFIRWQYRVSLSLTNMTDKYPPFHGRPEWD